MENRRIKWEEFGLREITKKFRDEEFNRSKNEAGMKRQEAGINTIGKEYSSRVWGR